MQNLSVYKAYLQHERRYSNHTLTAYVTDVEQFFLFLHGQYSVSEAAEVKPQMVKAWVYALSNEKLNPRSINRKLVSLNGFYKFLLRTGVVKQNPLAAIQSLKTPKRLYSWVAEDEMNHLLDAPYMSVPENAFSLIRDRLILEMLYGTGMRLAELISLQHNSLSLAEGTIKVLGKRNKERIIPIHKELTETIHIYNKQKLEAGFTCSGTLLVTDKGQPLYPMFVNRCVKKYIGAVSTVQKNSPHVLRHTYATHLLNNGADIVAIKELLGHANLAATQVYTHNSIERLKNIYKQAHPKG